MTERERIELGKKRLLKVVARHTVAIFRTLEQKISDAGPNPQRVDPHLLTQARQELEANGQLLRFSHLGTNWFHLPSTPSVQVQARLQEQAEVYSQTLGRDFHLRLGQTLEIAIFRALCGQELFTPLGAYPDLDQHDDSTPYRKEEHPSTIAHRSLPGNLKLDFLLICPPSLLGARPIHVGVEAKNIREWLYPDREEIRALLRKCCALDAVPVLIARRYHFVTFKVLSLCGVIFHQTFNQLFPESDRALADRIKHKLCLGFHDVRVGNHPDTRLKKFLHDDLPRVLPKARADFLLFKPLLKAYAFGEVSYREFAAEVKRRSGLRWATQPGLP